MGTNGCYFGIYHVYGSINELALLKQTLYKDTDVIIHVNVSGRFVMWLSLIASKQQI